MKVRTLRRSTGYITECSYREVSGGVYTAATSGTYGDARECARKHIRGEGEVWRQCFIAGTKVSGGCFAYGAVQWSRTRVLLR